MDDLSTKLKNKDAEVKVEKEKVTLTETVVSVFSKAEIAQNVANLTSKIEEIEKSVDQTKANIINLEQQAVVLKASRDNFRELLKQVEK